MKNLFLGILLAAAISLSTTISRAQSFDLSGHLLFENKLSFTPDEPSQMSLQGSGVYTTFNFLSKDETLRVFVENHWLQGENPGDLYKGLSYNCYNWLEMAEIDWTPKNLSFLTLSGGKIIANQGGVEGLYDNWEITTDFASSVWNTILCYQYGVRAAVNFWNTSLAFALTSSPYSNHYFENGLLGFNIDLTGEYGPFSLLWSADAFQNANGGYTWLIQLGQQLAFEKFSIGFDWFNKVGNYGLLEEDQSEDPMLLNGNTFKLDLDYSPIKQLDIKGQLGYETHSGCNQWYGGAILSYIPYEWIRLHLTGGYDQACQAPIAKLGVTVNFKFLK